MFRYTYSEFPYDTIVVHPRIFTAGRKISHPAGTNIGATIGRNVAAAGISGIIARYLRGHRCLLINVGIQEINIHKLINSEPWYKRIIDTNRIIQHYRTTLVHNSNQRHNLSNYRI
jgi:hypothetical protein